MKNQSPPATGPEPAEKLRNIDRLLSSLYPPRDPPQLQDPLETLVLTILSQNTTDVNRDRAFASMKRRFPAWAEVEKARPAELEASLRVGGLAAQKASRVQGALRFARERFGRYDLEALRKTGEEEARELLSALPGVGPKTLSIVLLFSLGFEAFPLDTHCMRVLKRLGVLPEKMNAEGAHRFMAGLVERGRSMPLHLNLISFGRERCRARKPLCEGCPLSGACLFLQARAVRKRT